MKYFYRFLIATAMLFFFAAGAAADGLVVAEMHETEWTWAEKNIAVFEGTVSSQKPMPDQVLLRLSFTVSPGDEDPGEVVFSAVNGKKLTIRKQKPEYVLDTGGTDRFDFSGSWKTPENVGFTKITITLQVYSGDGTELLAEKKMTASRSASEVAVRDDGRIRIRVNFSVWTGIIVAVAATIWAAAATRIILVSRNKAKGR